MFNLFKAKKCSHPNLDMSSNFQYCQDCGEMVELSWHVLRCACCGKKREAKSYLNEVKPVKRYCLCCGSKEFEVTKLDKVNYFDLRFAVLLKNDIDYKGNEQIQLWVDTLFEDKESSKLRFLATLEK